MNHIPHFELERIQSVWEHQVDYNLTESGLHPFNVRELLHQDQIDELITLPLSYTQTNGSIPLRTAISRQYEGCDRDNVIVTNGSAEANFIATWVTLTPGDELVYMLPNYMQIWGVAQNSGATIVPITVREELGWQIDLDELVDTVSSRTKVISVCNPNNPTGSILTEETRDLLVDLARSCDAWILADEVYRGAELLDMDTPSFWGKYEKVVVTGGLSKAYGLPGLRIGWLVGPKDFISMSWTAKDYTTIAPGALSDKIATFVLDPSVKSQIFERNKTILNDNLSYLQGWMSDQNTVLKLIPPKAGGMAFLRYDLNIGSTELANRLRNEESVLLVPGDCFGMDGFLRLGFGSEKSYLAAGLDRTGRFLDKLTND